MIGSNRKNLTAQKLKYLKANIEHFQFIAAHALRDNEQFSVLVDMLAKGSTKPAQITQQMELIIDSLTVTTDKLPKQSRSSGESSDGELKPLKKSRASMEKLTLKAQRSSGEAPSPKPLRGSVGTYLKSIRKSKGEEPMDFDTQLLGDLKIFAATIKRDLNDNAVSLGDFIDRADAAINPLSKADSNAMRDWVRRSK